jgi:organic hydroperoxide reductase OsmC/OhrA
MENKKFNFEVNAVWQKGNTFQLGSPVLKTQIITAIPPPFKDGLDGYWSAEHLFLASIVSCFTQTFQRLAELSELPFDSLSCSISGNVEMIDGVFAFHKVFLFPTLTLPLETYRAKAQLDLEKAERECIIIDSIKTKLVIETKILVNTALESFEVQ